MEQPAAVVTGANRGLGLELCRQLQQRGWHVVALCRSSSPDLQALSADAAPEGSGGSSDGGAAAGTVRIVTGVDISSDACVALLQQQLAGVPVGLLICNAGILGMDGVAELDLAAIRQQFEVNALGLLRVYHALEPNLQQGAAKVALITSKMGSITATREGGKNGSVGYRMSKAAANMAGQLLALELRPRGIPVLLIHPGAVETDMYRSYWSAVASNPSIGMAPSSHGAISVLASAAGVLQRLDELGLEGSGRFVQAATGEELPW